MTSHYVKDTMSKEMIFTTKLTALHTILFVTKSPESLPLAQTGSLGGRFLGSLNFSPCFRQLFPNPVNSAPCCIPITSACGHIRTL